MKKLGLIVLAVGIILMAGCAGDDPAGPSGSLDPVTGLTIEATSAGTSVDLSWNAVSDVDGYYVYFRTTSTADWTQAADVTGTTYTHDATSAGYYTVKAYKGDDTSSDNSNIVDTMPTDVTTTYTIYDNYSPATEPSGFIFGATSGETGQASSTSFDQDIYAYDEDKGKGDETVRLYSGDYGSFGNGSATWMADPSSTSSTYCNAYPNGSWYYNYGLLTSDERVYCYLSNGNYAKMYDLSIAADPNSANGTMVSFSYEIQTGGLTLFTSN